MTTAAPFKDSKGDSVEDGIKMATTADAASLSIGSVEQPIHNEKMPERYTFLTAFAIFVSCSGSWEAVCASLYQVLLGGGPTALFWGCILAGAGATFMAASLGEFASIWPTSAGQCHWIAYLAPKGVSRLMSWYSGYYLMWMQTFATIGSSLIASQNMIGIIAINRPEYTSERWHTYMVYLGISSISLLINYFVPKWLHQISLVGLTLHIAGFFAVSITLLATTKSFNPPVMMFAEIVDNTGYNSDAAAFFIGMLTSAFCFIGVDGPTHLSEEIKHPRVSVPRAMFWGTLTNFAITLCFIIVIGFCMGDPQALLSSPIISISPLSQIVVDKTGSLAAATALVAPVIIVSTVAAIEGNGIAARVVMSQARDNVVPFGNWLSAIHPRYKTPGNALLFLALVQYIIGAIYIGNTTAFYGISSGYVALQVVTFLLPVAVHLIYRPVLNLTYGPWRWPMALSCIMNVLACAIFIIILGAMMLPQSYPVTAASMNYASVILVSVFVLATTLWFLKGRKDYHGPLYRYSN